jgi:outer membrane protein TolC
VPSTPAAQAVTLAELLQEALRVNPEIRAAQQLYEGMRLRPSIVSSLPDPRLGFMSNNIGNPVPGTTLGEEDMSTLGFSLMQEIPFPGKLNLQGQVAEKEAEREWEAYKDIQLQVASRLKQAYFRWRFVHQALAVLQRNTDLLNQFTKIAEARYQIGQGIQQDVLRAQTETSMLEGRRLELEAERSRLAAQINMLLNRAPDAPLGAPADYPHAELSVTLAELYTAVEDTSPRLAQSQAGVGQKTLAWDLSRKDYYPDFAVETGWASRGRLRDMWETRVEVRIPLYFWRKQRYAIREAAQAVEQARHEHDATRQALLFRVKDDYLAAKTSEQLLDLYSKTLMPQASLALESAMASYQTGALDFLSLVTNFQSVLEYELEYYEQLATFYEALARLEEATGRQLIP